MYFKVQSSKSALPYFPIYLNRKFWSKSAALGQSAPHRQSDQVRICIICQYAYPLLPYRTPTRPRQEPMKPTCRNDGSGQVFKADMVLVLVNPADPNLIHLKLSNFTLALEVSRVLWYDHVPMSQSGVRAHISKLH